MTTPLILVPDNVETFVTYIVKSSMAKLPKELTLSDLGDLEHSMPGGDSAPPFYLCCCLRYDNQIWHKGCSLYKQ